MAYRINEFFDNKTISILLNNNFKITGSYKIKDFWIIKIFGKYKKIYKPFKKITYIKVIYTGED